MPTDKEEKITAKQAPAGAQDGPFVRPTGVQINICSGGKLPDNPLTGVTDHEIRITIDLALNPSLEQLILEYVAENLLKKSE